VASRGIPTWHEGVQFRSRGEARWAKFWDHLGIKWQYEPQGFDTDGHAYLPDFAVFAACGTLWVEIKPGWGLDPDGEARWRRFAPQRPNPATSRAVLLAGPPAIKGRAIVIGGDRNAENPGDSDWEDDGQEWRPCPSGAHFDLAYPGMFNSKFAADGCEDRFGGLGEQGIADAVSAALSARFTGGRPDTGTAA
jgi:hypothetical protein